MSFDTLAPYYRWMELVLAGQKLHRCRTAFLSQISRPQNILLLGEGHGRALVECRRQFASSHITCVDASRGMLEQARRRLERCNANSDRVDFIHADALAWQPPANTYDLIITHFFFDCFRADQLGTLVPGLAGGLTEDANWLVADFQIPAQGLKRVRSRLIIWSLYLFFRVMTRLPTKVLTQPDTFLEAAGFKLNQRIESEWGLLRSDYWRRTISV
jgi:SAM-dependent methyltransferase